MNIEVNGQTISVKYLKMEFDHKPAKLRKGAYGPIGITQADPDVALHVTFLDARQASQFRALAVGDFALKWSKYGLGYQAIGCDTINAGLHSVITLRPAE